MPNTPKELGTYLKSLRIKQGLTQEGLGEKLGLAKSTIALYEAGNNNFTVTTLKRVAEALGGTLEIEIIFKS